jgi:hypothetical protein
MLKEEMLYTFETPYFYVIDSNTFSPNYTLYDIFSLRTNLQFAYPEHDVSVIDQIKQDKVYSYVFINSIETLNEQEKNLIKNSIDFFTDSNRQFVLIFPFDSELRNEDGKLIPKISLNYILQLIELRTEVNADDWELWNQLNSPELQYIGILNENNFDKLDQLRMSLEYKFTGYGLSVNLSDTGYYQILYDMLYRLIQSQILQVYNLGFCFCSEDFRRKWNLIEYRKESSVTNNWKIQNILINKNKSEVLKEIQEYNSITLNLSFDQVDKHFVSHYLNRKNINFIFFSVGINIEFQDYEQMNDFSIRYDEIKSIQDCKVNIELTDELEEDTQLITYYQDSDKKVKSSLMV